MPTGDTREAGPVANFAFAAVWLGLGIWTIATPGTGPLRWIQLAGYAVMTVAFSLLGVRRLRARRREG